MALREASSPWDTKSEFVGKKNCPLTWGNWAKCQFYYVLLGERCGFQVTFTWWKCMNMWFPSQFYMRKDVGFKTSFDGKWGMNRMFEPRYVVCTPLFGKPMRITKTSNGWGAKKNRYNWPFPHLVRRDFEDWSIQFWGYMILRHKCSTAPQNRSNNWRRGNYGNDWVESFKTASKQMYDMFFSYPSRSMWHMRDSCNNLVWG